MWYRVCISVIAFVLGIFYLSLLDGQTFTNTIVCMVFITIGAIPWLSVMLKPEKSKRKIAARWVVGVSVLILILLGISLPQAWKFQQNFNERTHMSPDSP